MTKSNHKKKNGKIFNFFKLPTFLTQFPTAFSSPAEIAGKWGGKLSIKTKNLDINGHLNTASNLSACMQTRSNLTWPLMHASNQELYNTGITF